MQAPLSTHLLLTLNESGKSDRRHVAEEKRKAAEYFWALMHVEAGCSGRVVPA